MDMFLFFYFFFFFFFSLEFCALFESPRGDRIYCLVEVGKGCHKLYNLSFSKIGLAVLSCTREIVFQWNGKIRPFPQTSLHEWLVEL